MYQPRRLSPASSSPLYRNVNIPCNISIYLEAHQVKLQLKQITPSNNPPQYISICPQQYTKVFNQPENNIRQISKERESIPKGYQSMDSKDAQVQSSSFTQSIMKQSQQILLQNYVDTALRNQKQEMLKLFDQQNKQIEFMQQIIVSQTNNSNNELEEKIKNTITKLGQEIEGKLKKTYQKEFQTIFAQLETLKTQIFQVNITNSKLISEKLHSSFEVEDYHQRQKQNYQNKKQDIMEQKHSQDNQSYILNLSKYENECSQQPFQDITNIPIKYIKSLQQSLQNSKISKCSSTNNTKQEDDSPIEVFCEQNLLDSLDNIKVFDPQYQNKSNQSESMECILQFNLEQCRMSTIHENEYEDEDCFHQLEDIAYSLDKNPLLDNNGKKKIQQSKQLKSKTLYY